MVALWEIKGILSRRRVKTDTKGNNFTFQCSASLGGVIILTRESSLNCNDYDHLGIQELSTGLAY